MTNHLTPEAQKERYRMFQEALAAGATCADLTRWMQSKSIRRFINSVAMSRAMAKQKQ